LHRSNKAPIKVKVQNVLIESSENAVQYVAHYTLDG
jgi:hypothetical protein